MSFAVSASDEGGHFEWLVWRRTADLFSYLRRQDELSDPSDDDTGPRKAIQSLRAERAFIVQLSTFRRAVRLAGLRRITRHSRKSLSDPSSLRLRRGDIWT